MLVDVCELWVIFVWISMGLGFSWFICNVGLAFSVSLFVPKRPYSKRPN